MSKKKNPFGKILRKTRSRGSSFKADQLPTYLKKRREGLGKLSLPPRAIEKVNRTERAGSVNGSKSPVEVDSGMKHRTPFHKPLMFRRGNASTVKMVRRLRGMFHVCKTDIEECSAITLAPFLFNTMDYVIRHPTLGQFRKCGSNLKIHKVESGFPCNTTLLRQVDDIHVVGELIKFFLRELPKPLLRAFYGSIILSGMEINRESVVEIMKDHLTIQEKMITIKLFKTLKNVVSNKDVTRMNESSLSIVFTPNMYTKDLVALLKNQVSHDRARFLTEYLIIHTSNLQFEILEEDHEFFKNEKDAFIASFDKAVPEIEKKKENTPDSSDSCDTDSDSDDSDTTTSEEEDEE